MASAAIVSVSKRPSDKPILVAISAAIIALTAKLVLFLIFSARAVAFPYELDYGEGIVWQQMLLMLSGQGYGAIDGMPAIVFHYPPVYHGLVMALSETLALDQLATGRLVSLAATLLVGALTGMIAYRVAKTLTGRATAALCGVAGALIGLAFTPVAVWAPLMRVDMAAMAFSLAGLWFGLLALERPRMVLAAALCFVLAIYTKQTSVAAPASTFLVLLLTRPRTAMLGVAACLTMGLGVLGALAWASDGGFLRHIFLYNINRFEPARLIWIPQSVMLHLMFFVAAAAGVMAGLTDRFPAFRAKRRLASLREDLRSSPADATFLMLLAYLFSATAMLALVAKSGSSVNYLIEWMLASAIFAGIGVAALVARPGKRRLALLLPLAITVQVALLPTEWGYGKPLVTSRGAEADRLFALIRGAQRPVISDDMVILLRNGKPVQWEPAIFAELASTGVWDERPFVERIRAREFAFFVTVGARGEQLFDSRYNPAVADAIEAAYPVRREVAGYMLHLPSTD